jgi:hypothetical protein
MKQFQTAQVEADKETGAEMDSAAKRNNAGQRNGAGKKANAPRPELAVLGWAFRSSRLAVK